MIGAGKVSLASARAQRLSGAEDARYAATAHAAWAPRYLAAPAIATNRTPAAAS